MGTLILLGLAFANWALHRWVLRPKVEEAKAADVYQVSLPRATESAPVPLIYGRVRVRGGNVVWHGLLDAEPIKDADGNTVGYHYSLAFILVLGISGGTDGCRLGNIWVDDKLAGYGFPWLATSGQFLIAGSSDEIGGIGAWYGGSSAAGFSTPGATFEDVVLPRNGEIAAYFPRYKRFASMIFYTEIDDGRHMGFALGASTSPGAISAEVQADCAGIVDTSLGAIGDGDANPANVLYDLLTNPFGRLGLDGGLIDLPSFLSAGQTLRDEQHGFSIVLYNANDARAIIRDILEQVAGVLYWDPSTMLIVFRLIRAGATPVVTLDEDNVIAVTRYSQGLWSDTYNEIRVIYTDRSREYTERTIFATDIGNYATQGVPRTYDRTFPGISNSSTAADVAARELRATSRPLKRIRLQATRDAFSLRPGDVFNLDWPEYQISGVGFRVQRFDLGDSSSNVVTIDAIEDVFNFDRPALWTPPPFIRKSPFPGQLAARRAEECPRWIALQARNAGRIASEDTPHAWYLAIAGRNSLTYDGRVASSGGTSMPDADPVRFPSSATLSADYTREAEPYDATGMTIFDVVGDTPPTLSAGLFSVSTQIGTFGANLAIIDDEIVAFESVTDLGGGAFQLENVWRGLLDTVPRDHAAGARVWFLSDQIGIASFLEHRRIGVAQLSIGGSYDLRIEPITAGGRRMPVADLPVDTIACTGRPSRPYPAANLSLAGSKTPGALTVDAVDVAWRKRLRTSSTIVRGDAASETPEVGTTYDLRGEKRGNNPYAALDLQTGLSGTSATRARLSRAGHGTIAVSLRSQAAGGASWQDPELEIIAYHWRNLLSDARWAYNDGSWITTSGTGTVTGTGGVGNAPYYTGATGPVGANVVHQICDVTGYRPGRLRAQVAVYALSGNAGDTLQITIAALNSSGTSLGTSTTTVTPSTIAWARVVLTYADLPSSTAKLDITFTTTSATPASAAPTIKISESCLRLGHGGASQLIASNPDFETGTAGWTVDAGGFTASTTAPLYTGAQYLIASTASATCTIHQDAALPAGFEWGVAILECARMNQGAAGSADAGEVKVQALNGGGTVLATATTGSETFTADQWNRRQVVLDVPEGTATLRVTFTAAAGVAGSKRAAIDDVSLYVWKQLDPSTVYAYDLTAPVAQDLPVDEHTWARSTSIAIPDAIWDGSSLRPSRGGCDLAADAGVIAGGRWAGQVASDGTSATTSAFDFTRSYRDVPGDVHAASNAAWGNWGLSDRWAVMIIIRSGFTTSSGNVGLIGKIGDTGWGVYISAGVASLVIQGDGTLIEILGTHPICDGAAHMIAVVVDGTNVSLVDEDGIQSVSMSGLTEYAQDTAAAVANPFRIGRAYGTDAPFGGQVARVYAWHGAAITTPEIPTPAELLAWWTHGADPLGGAITASRAGALVVELPDDATTGARCAVISETQIPLSHAGGDWGLGVTPSDTNLAPQDQCGVPAGWTTGGSPVLSHFGAGPDGLLRATSIEGDNAAYLEMSTLAVGAVAGSVAVVWYARSTTGAAFSMRASLYTSAGVLSDSYDQALTADGLWIRCAHVFTWTGATATAKLRFYASSSATTRTIEIAGPYFVGVGPLPRVFSPASGAAFSYASISGSLSNQVAAEGELIVRSTHAEALPARGTLACVRAASGNVDRRRLYLGASSAAKLDHYDGAAVLNTAATSGGGIPSDRTIATTDRARWCQAELFDAASVFSGVQTESLAYASGRVATWTRGSASLQAIDLGHNATADVSAAVIHAVSLYVREIKR